jgi:hypothetical protein
MIIQYSSWTHILVLYSDSRQAFEAFEHGQAVKQISGCSGMMNNGPDGIKSLPWP